MRSCVSGRPGNLLLGNLTLLGFRSVLHRRSRHCWTYSPDSDVISLSGRNWLYTTKEWIHFDILFALILLFLLLDCFSFCGSENREKIQITFLSIAFCQMLIRGNVVRLRHPRRPRWKENLSCFTFRIAYPSRIGRLKLVPPRQVSAAFAVGRVSPAGEVLHPGCQGVFS